jgi:adenosylmethionine-8-amino-7-oxononanoate aminotransferase
MPRIVTLTTDFGTGSVYVAQLKAAILQAAAPPVLVDIAHDLPAHDIRAAAWLVGQACLAFPAGTLHIAVVDPGVGTPRPLAWARIGEQDFLAPDNGLLSWALARAPFVAARALEVPADAAATFHGRDVIAPAAVRLLDGAPSESLGPALASLVRLPCPEPRETDAGLEGEVIHVDAFGNLVTNLPASLWPRVAAAGALHVGGHAITTLVRTYGDAAPGTAVALVGSQGFIEAAVVEGRADVRLAAAVGTPVSVEGMPASDHRTPTIGELLHWDREHVWHAFTQMQEYEPLLIESGEGATLFDTAGKAYLDGSASMWCNVHGHRHPRLDAALRAQLDKVAHTTNLGLSNPTTVELARRLVEIAPPGLEKVFFTGDGSSAIEAALKMAFQYWRQAVPPQPARTRFVAIGEAYHGDTLGAIGVGGVDRFTALFGPLTFAAIRIPSPGGPCPHTGRPAPSLDDALAALEQTLAEHAGSIAALVMEPLMQAAGGILVHPPGFLRGVRDLTTKHDVLLILDEVAVGFGRTGTMFACEQEAVVPDILCLAKGLTAGYLPMAATLTTERLWRAFLGTHAEQRTFFHGHTYGGNPLAAAVALASLDVFRDERVLESLPAKIARLGDHVARLAALDHVGDVRQCGLVAGLDLVADKASRRPYPWQEQRGTRACLAARPHGAILRQLGDTVVLMPPLCITLDEIDRLATAAEAGILTATSS